MKKNFRLLPLLFLTALFSLQPAASVQAQEPLKSSTPDASASSQNTSAPPASAPLMSEEKRNEEATKNMSREESIRFYRQRNKLSPQASRVYNGYVGIEGGLAIASGTYLPVNTGFAYGITAGVDTPVIGFGFTARHEFLSVFNTDSKENITQLLLELNIFSYLLLNGGVQVGDIITKIDDQTSHSLGLGLHVGFDLHFTKALTAGLGAYWTYVTQNSDKHSLFNIMIPFKYWF